MMCHPPLTSVVRTPASFHSFSFPPLNYSFRIFPIFFVFFLFFSIDGSVVPLRPRTTALPSGTYLLRDEESSAVSFASPAPSVVTAPARIEAQMTNSDGM